MGTVTLLVSGIQRHNLTLTYRTDCSRLHGVYVRAQSLGYDRIPCAAWHVPMTDILCDCKCTVLAPSPRASVVPSPCGHRRCVHCTHKTVCAWLCRFICFVFVEYTQVKSRDTGLACLPGLCCIVFPRCCVLYKRKAGLSGSRKITTR